MTVAEFIEQLRELDPNVEIRIRDPRPMRRHTMLPVTKAERIPNNQAPAGVLLVLETPEAR